MRKNATAATIPASPPAEPAGFLTLTGFTAEYGVGCSFIYDLIAAGKLRPVKAGSRTLIPRAEAQRWAASLPCMRAA